MKPTPEIFFSQIVDRVGVARWPRGGKPNPVRGGPSIEPPDTNLPDPFCFSAARRRAVQDSCTQGCRRAAEKQKGGFYLRVVSINRSPLAGFEKNSNGLPVSTRKMCPRCSEDCAWRVPVLYGRQHMLQRRSAPVLGRSNIGVHSASEKCNPAQPVLARCARGRAHPVVVYPAYLAVTVQDSQPPLRGPGHAIAANS
jgi:hypothetical protein